MAVLTCEVRLVRCTAKRSMFFSTAAHLGTNFRQQRRSFDLYRRSSVHVAEKKSPWRRKMVSGRGEGGDGLGQKEEDDLWAETRSGEREDDDPGCRCPRRRSSSWRCRRWCVASGCRAEPWTEEGGAWWCIVRGSCRRCRRLSFGRLSERGFPPRPLQTWKALPGKSRGKGGATPVSRASK